MNRNRSFTKERSALASCLALAPLLSDLAACEPRPPEEAAREEAPPAAVPGPPAAPEAAAPPPEAQQVVTVRVTADSVDVSPATIGPGSTTIQVTSGASVPYDVDVDGPGPDGEVENLQPNETRSITMMLQSGTYEIESSAEQGPERERKARLTVRD